MAGLDMRMDAVGSEDELVAEGFLFFVGLREFGFPLEFAGFGEFGDFHAHVDGGDAVVIGDAFHGAGAALEFAVEQGGHEGLGDGIDEADVALGEGAPGLADDALHAADDLLGLRAAIIDGELDEEEVGLLIEHVLFETADAEVGAGATDGGIDLAELGLRVGFLEMGERFDAPSRLRGDAAAEVADL